MRPRQESLAFTSPGLPPESTGSGYSLRVAECSAGSSM